MARKVVGTDDRIRCPRCFEKGLESSELEPCRRRRFLDPAAPYATRREMRCPTCRRRYDVIDRLTWLGITRGAGVTPRRSLVGVGLGADDDQGEDDEAPQHDREQDEQQ